MLSTNPSKKGVLKSQSQFNTSRQANLSCTENQQISLSVRRDGSNKHVKLKGPGILKMRQCVTCQDFNRLFITSAENFVSKFHSK